MEKEVMQKLLRQKVKFLAHCRLATLGKVCEDNIHFFEYGDWIIAQNGTINGLADDKECDTIQVIKMLKHIKSKNIAKFLNFFEARFLLYNRKTGQKIRTGNWFKSHNAMFSKANVLDEKTYKLRYKWKNQNNKSTYYNSGSNPYYDYHGYNYDAKSTVIDVKKSNKKKKEFAEEYLVFENGIWKTKKMEENIPAKTYAVAVYDNYKKGKLYHKNLKNAKLILEGKTSFKFPLILDGNDVYAINDMKVTASQIPVEVYNVSEQVYNAICKDNSTIYEKSRQLIIPNDTDEKDAIIATMFFYPKEQVKTTFDNPEYVTEFN